MNTNPASTPVHAARAAAYLPGLLLLLALAAFALCCRGAAAQTPGARTMLNLLLFSGDAPLVSIIAPANNAVVSLNPTTAIVAEVSDPSGVAKVEFFVNGTLAGTVTSTPWTVNWTPPTGGSYTLTARATNNIGDNATSAPVVVTAANTGPNVTLTSPANNALFSAPATIPLRATASDLNGVQKIEYYRDSTLVATSTAGPNYPAADSNVPAGIYNYTAKAYDNTSLSTVSAPATVTVASVALSSPTGGQLYTAPGALTLTAVPAVPSGLQRIDFYQGATLVGSASSSPYTYAWNSVAAGVYNLTAKAVYAGGSVVSPVTAVTVTNTSLGTPQSVNPYYVYADHLDTPRAITTSASTPQVVWRWDNSEPFGNNAPDQNPGGVGVFVFNMRLPGQYFDLENGLSYNYFRDGYDPATGRYMQFDPIGLRGGVNGFNYVGSNPLSFADPTGLLVGIDDAVIIGGVLVVGAVISSPAGQNAISGAVNAVKQICLPDDPCNEFQRRLNEFLDLMDVKYSDLLRDNQKLYTKAFSQPVPGLNGTWQGHVDRYNGLVIGLQNLINEGKAKGCVIPTRAYMYLTRFTPDRPTGK